MMINKETAPTFEEFETAVEACLVPLIRNGSTAREYIRSEEGCSTVKERYDICLQKFNNGEITRHIFLGDSAFSVAWCLYMMYE